MKVKQPFRYEYISFDVFDTLIKRNIACPTDVFRLVEIKYNELYPENAINDFYYTRKEAERQARRRAATEEVRFDEIYQQLENTYNLQTVKRLKELEIEIEHEVCVLNRDMISVFQDRIEQGKKVILISDMYLSADIIRKILENNGIVGYRKLYVSSEIGLKKRTGSLYRYVLKDLNIRKDQLFHIGDNKKSDFLSPMLIGIRAIPISSHICHLRYFNEEDIHGEELFAYRTMSAFINNNILREESVYWEIGYEILGPLLYGFTRWLLKDLKRKGIKKAFFLSRDGYIIKKAFDIVNDTDIKSEYFYASRRALVIPSFWLNANLEEILNYSYLCKKITVSKFIEELGLSPDRYINLLKTHNLNLDSVIDFRKIQKESGFIDFYSAIKPEVIVNSKDEYQIFLDYMEQSGFIGNVAIIDIGWKGSLQSAIQKIVKVSQKKVNLFGYYIGLKPKNNYQKEDMNMNGFLFQQGKREECSELEALFEALVETMFSANHGSVEKFKKDKNNKVFPIFKQHEHLLKTGKCVNELHIIKEIQRGAIQFVNEFTNEEISQYIEASPNCVFRNFLRLGLSPSKWDTEIFGDIRYLNININYLAKPSNLTYYILNPKKLISDFSNSCWRIGFMKRLFKLPLPYSSIYRWIRKIYLR